MQRPIVTILLALTGAAGIQAAPPPVWSARPFDYQRPGKLDIRESDKDVEYALMKSRQMIWTFSNTREDTVSVLITLPEKKSRQPLPVVLIVHGFADDAQHVTRRVGRQLIDAGFACVAPDLPHHGQRSGVPKDMFAGDMETVLAHFRQGIIDIRQTIDFAETRDELDTSNGVLLLGYSTGAWLATLAGAADTRVKAMALISAGAAAIDTRKAESGAEGLLFRYPEVRPVEAIPQFSPRPLIMLNGRRDALIPEQQVRRLFSAAGSPKELRWYENKGHLLPAEANEEIARWLARRWKDAGKAARTETATAPAR